MTVFTKHVVVENLFTEENKTKKLYLKITYYSSITNKKMLCKLRTSVFNVSKFVPITVTLEMPILSLCRG